MPYLRLLQVAKTTTVCLMCPPYVLASERDTYFAVSDMMADRSDQSAVLFCTYCLSADQQWLLAACTDHRGELLDTVTINIDVPNAHLRKKASARRVGLRRLWEFVMGVVSKTTTMWRVVIGRFGRLGHGELKGEWFVGSKKDQCGCGWYKGFTIAFFANCILTTNHVLIVC